MNVAPYVGAWIETKSLASMIKSHLLSHLTWVRGLKLYHNQNNSTYRPVAPYVGAWIETDVFDSDRRK